MIISARTVFGGILAIGFTTIIAIQYCYAARQYAPDRRTSLVIDLMDGAYMPGHESLLVTGPHGLVGKLKIGAEKATLVPDKNVTLTDYTVLARVSDTEVLLGSGIGHLYFYDGAELQDLGAMSEYPEPILDIDTGGNHTWAVGARGIVVKSTDNRSWEPVEIRDVEQPQIALPGVHAGEWYFGVSNIDTESFKLTAYVNGEPAVADEHYVLYPDEGFMQIVEPFDVDPMPSVSFIFNPGPPFRAGDVSWNIVLAEDDKVTLAGEFGMVIQSTDGGETWTRRDAVITDKEPQPPYWIAGTQRGDLMELAGAAGISTASSDGGVTWTRNPVPGREGIFGVTLLDDGTPLIAGAVGLIGTLDGQEWSLADRTELKLLSWLKTPIEMPDGSVLVLGGRSTLVRYKDGTWMRIPVVTE